MSKTQMIQDGVSEGHIFITIDNEVLPCLLAVALYKTDGENARVGITLDENLDSEHLKIIIDAIWGTYYEMHK